MPVHKHIQRLSKEDKDRSFDYLKQKGLEFIQDLSGGVWTDYNLHDPGITILEQLCFALTEIFYKSELSVSDLLTREDGKIDLKKQALFLPEQIYASQAITVNDYRKIIFDQVPGIIDVWLYPDQKESVEGLYNIIIELSDRILDLPEEVEKIVPKVKKVFLAHRNLSEDVSQIHIKKNCYIDLCADIELNRDIAPEETLAKILYTVSRHLTPGIIVHSYEKVADEGMPIEEIFTGPLLENGYIKDEELFPYKSSVYIVEIVSIINDIQSIDSITNIFLEKDGNLYQDEIYFEDEYSGPKLRIPKSLDELKINLYKDGRKHKLNLTKVHQIYNELLLEYYATYNVIDEIRKIAPIPKGNYVQPMDYYSVQNHFPDIYGINSFGIPKGEAPKRKAQAKQLKTYLLLFEQILANMYGQIEHIKDIFSIGREVKETYFGKPLTDVPNIAGLVQGTENTENKEKLNHVLSSLVDTVNKGHDPVYDRKNRVLDYLLALYGEKFTQYSLQRFNYYYKEDEFFEHIVDNKTLLLENIIEFSRYKALAINYSEKSWGTYNISGLKKRVSVLLGIKNFLQRSFTDVFASRGIRLVGDNENACNDCAIGVDLSNFTVGNESIENEFRNIPYTEPEEDVDTHIIEKFFDEYSFIYHKSIHESFLRFGIDLERYRIGKLEDLPYYIIVFRPGELEEWIYIGAFEDYNFAVNAINALRKFLVKLNVESEGLHIVENLLLRPKDDDKYKLSIITDELVLSTICCITHEQKTMLIEKLNTVLLDLQAYFIENIENEYFIVLKFGENNYLSSKQSFTDKIKAEKSLEQFLSTMKHYVSLELVDTILETFHFKENGLEIPEGFFSFRISVIFPSWTARFHNSKFRMLAEDTVIKNTPAHLHPQFYWLGPSELKEFEILYRDWLKLKRSGDANKFDVINDKLIHFLIENKKG